VDIWLFPKSRWPNSPKFRRIIDNALQRAASACPARKTLDPMTFIHLLGHAHTGQSVKRRVRWRAAVETSSLVDANES